MDNKSIFNIVKQDFCSLWTFKERGATLEIITPFSTTNNKFISVFVTFKNEEYIVTDGGWIHSGEYGVKLVFDEDIFLKIYHHYLGHFQIKTLEYGGSRYYFKTSSSLDMLSSIVYDLGNFMSAISSACQIQFYDQKEKSERDNFNKQVNVFLTEIVKEGSILFNQELSADYKNVRFNAVLANASKLTLIKYITGSASSYFLSSLTKSIVDFEIANHSPFNNVINDRIAIVNDTAQGFNENKIFRYIQTLEDHTQRKVVKWSDKDQLVKILG